MGASTFFQTGRGDNPKLAFQAAVKAAQYDYGHRGYTGSLAEKQSFVMIEAPDNLDPRMYAQDLVSKGDRRIDDKWGPAGCIKTGENEYLFFGWASS